MYLGRGILAAVGTSIVQELQIQRGAVQRLADTAIPHLGISGRGTGWNFRTPEISAFTEAYEALTNTHVVASPRVHELNPRKYRANRTT